MQIPKINVDWFENDYYKIYKTNNINCTVNIIDFIQSGPTSQTTNANWGQPLSFTSNSSNISTIQPTILQHNIKLKSLLITIKNSILVGNQIQIAKNIFDSINSNINNDFFKKAEQLGNKARKNDINFDFSIKKLEKNTKNDPEIGGTILHTIQNASSYIAVNSRLGPANWIVINKKTYDSIYKYMINLNLSYDNNNNLLINNKTKLIVNNFVNDNEILLGRNKNQDQPGIGVFLLTDENNNLLIYEQPDYVNLTKNIMVYYAVEELGSNPEKSYLKINTTNLSEQRYKKLQKINQLK